MSNWRAKIRFPVAADRAVRNFASKNERKLKDLLHELLDSGLVDISAKGLDYEFSIDKVLKDNNCDDCNYVVDDTYKDRIQAQVHLLNGRGKQGKVFAESLLVGMAKHKINW